MTDLSPITGSGPNRRATVDVPLLRTYVDLKALPDAQFTYGDGSFRFATMQRVLVHYRAHGGPEAVSMSDVTAAVLRLRALAAQSPSALRSLLSHPSNAGLSEALRRRSPVAWQELFTDAD